MIAKFQQSWALFKASIAVTFQHPKLLWFPFLTTILTGIIALFFISAMIVPYALAHRNHDTSQVQQTATPTSAAADQAKHSDDSGSAAQSGNVFLGQPVHSSALFAWLFGLPIYLLSMFLATFFNVAFYNEIIAALNGRGVSLRRGLGVAFNRLPSILAWSLLAGLVGWLIRTIEERLPFFARIITGIIGMAWSIAAVFAIPVIVQNQSQRNPLKVLQQSAMTLRQAWGEGLIGYIGFSAGGLVIFFFSLVPLLAAAALAWFLKSWWIAAIGGALWVLAMLLISYVSGVARHVYRCALYLYAAEGAVPGPYSQDLLDMAWKVKKI